MSIRQFYKDIKKNDNTELNQLYKNPKPETGINMPISQVFTKNIYYQADLLYMPEDEKFKYILVCVDMYDNTVDAEPLKNREQKDILDAFKLIFKRKYLKFPKFITFDKGSEFGEKVKEYFIKNKTNVKYALTNRHRMLANVERMNQTLGIILFKRMTSQELLTGEINKNWISDLPELIKVLNDEPRKVLNQEISDLPLIDKYNGKLLTIGDKVRISLDYPINNTNHKRLNGNFRSTDIKFSPTIYTITEVLIKPGFPPLYLTSKNDNVARTKNQLSKVLDDEKTPNPDYIRDDTEYHIVEKIINRKIENRKTFYLIKWKGLPNDKNSWIHVDELNRTKELKDMKNKFNSQH